MHSLRTVHVMLVAACAVSVFEPCCSSGGGGGPSGSQEGVVTFAAKCEVPPSCGGDPTGHWRVVGGCVEPPAGGFECAEGVSTGHGTIKGTFTLDTGGFSLDANTELRQCGWVDDSGSGNGGSVTIQGNQLMLGGTETLTFCVDGSTLWLYGAAAEYPDLRVQRLVRDLDAGG